MASWLANLKFPLSFRENLCCVIHQWKCQPNSQRCFKITEKCLIEHLHLEWTKDPYNCPKWSIWASFRKPEAGGQTVLPDKTVFLRGQKLVENYVWCIFLVILLEENEKLFCLSWPKITLKIYVEKKVSGSPVRWYRRRRVFSYGFWSETKRRPLLGKIWPCEGPKSTFSASIVI